MSRIGIALDKLRASGRFALVPYVTVGYPDIETTLELVPSLVSAGADLIELGVPFSDPIADGITIQRASHAALNAGVTPGKCLETAARIRSLVDTPILMMGYYNPIHRYGIDAYCRDAASSGVDGLIVPDLPPEEADDLLQSATHTSIDIVFMIAPSSTDRRIRAICEKAAGFIYCVSLLGVTGARKSLASGLTDFVARVRCQTDLPLVMGFGISRPEHIAKVKGLADGAAVGSALLDRLESYPVVERVAAASSFLATLRRAADSANGVLDGRNRDDAP